MCVCVCGGGELHDFFWVSSASILTIYVYLYIFIYLYVTVTCDAWRTVFNSFVRNGCTFLNTVLSMSVFP